MTDQKILVGVSERTFAEHSGSLGPGIRMVPVPASNSLPRVDLDGRVFIAWRRQWDRTSWVSALLDNLPELRWVHTDTAGVDRLLPAVFAKVHPTWATPHFSILVLGMAASGLSIAVQAGKSLRGACFIPILERRLASG